MDELLHRRAMELTAMVEAGTFAGYYSALGFLADTAREVLSLQTINSEES